MLLDVIDADPLGMNPLVVPQHVEDHPRALVLVGQVRRVHQHQLLRPRGQVEMLQEHGRLVARVLVQADLADPEHPVPVRGTRGSSRSPREKATTFSASLALMHSQQ